MEKSPAVNVPINDLVKENCLNESVNPNYLTIF